MVNFNIEVPESQVKKEKQKARELRHTRWWQQKRDEGVCEYCGGTFPPDEITMDHIVPLIRGGLSVKNNIVACCKECNNRKRYLLPMEWEEYLRNK